MKFSLATLALSALTLASPTPDAEHDKRLLFKSSKNQHAGVPFTFTSTYDVLATPDQVVNPDNEFTGGLEGSYGIFKFGINSHEDIICYNITLFGFRGDYQSPAKTATHIHEGPKGKAGPPRIAFPNPVGDEKRRSSIGCLKGPFITGVLDDNKVDTGNGFMVKEIEANPSAFFADSHSSEAVPGAFRGQLDHRRC